MPPLYGREYFFFDLYNDEPGHIPEHYRRIKIFKKAGFEWADVSIPYCTYENTEEVDGLRARITLPNGLHYALDKENFLRARVDERWPAAEFAFPKVEEGAVLEYSYRLVSDYMIELNLWY